MIANPLKSSLWGQNGDRITVGGYSEVSKTGFPHLQFSFWVLLGHDLLGELGFVRDIPRHDPKSTQIFTPGSKRGSNHCLRVLGGVDDVDKP